MAKVQKICGSKKDDFVIEPCCDRNDRYELAV